MILGRGELQRACLGAWFYYGSNKWHEKWCIDRSNLRKFNRVALEDYSPEKAGTARTCEKDRLCNVDTEPYVCTTLADAAFRS